MRCFRAVRAPRASRAPLVKRPVAAGAPDDFPTIFSSNLAFLWGTAESAGGDYSDIVTLSATAVTQFLDLTANNRDSSVQSTGSLRPTWTTSAINGHPAMSYDGGDRLQWASAWNQESRGAVYVVAQAVGTGTNPVLLPTSSTGIFPHFGDTSPGNHIPHVKESSTVQATWGAAVTDWKIYRFEWDFSGGTKYTRISVGNGAAVEDNTNVGTTGTWSRIGTTGTNGLIAFVGIVAGAVPTAQQHSDALEYLSHADQYGSGVV